MLLTREGKKKKGSPSTQTGPIKRKKRNRKFQKKRKFQKNFIEKEKKRKYDKKRKKSFLTHSGRARANKVSPINIDWVIRPEGYY